MDNFIIKLIDLFKLPGLIVAILYFVWQQKFISIIKSSDTEKLFFTHEKKQVYMAFNWICLFLITFTLVTTMTFTLLFLIPKYKFITITLTKVVINLLFFSIALISIILYFFRKHNNAISILSRINGNERKLTVIFTFYYIITILTVAYTVSTGVQTSFENNKELIVIENVGIICLFLPGFLKSLISPWIYKERTLFRFNQDGDVWFILKILKENEFLVGDKCEEIDCKKIKFIGYEELKKKDILIDKIKID